MFQCSAFVSCVCVIALASQADAATLSTHSAQPRDLAGSSLASPAGLPDDAGAITPPTSTPALAANTNPFVQGDRTGPMYEATRGEAVEAIGVPDQPLLLAGLVDPFIGGDRTGPMYEATRGEAVSPFGTFDPPVGELVNAPAPGVATLLITGGLLAGARRRRSV